MRMSLWMRAGLIAAVLGGAVWAVATSDVRFSDPEISPGVHLTLDIEVDEGLMEQARREQQQLASIARDEGIPLTLRTAQVAELEGPVILEELADDGQEGARAALLARYLSYYQTDGIHEVDGARYRVWHLTPEQLEQRRARTAASAVESVTEAVGAENVATEGGRIQVEVDAQDPDAKPPAGR